MEENKKSGLSTAGLVLGIVGVCLSFIPIINFVSFILSILAIIFGVICIIRKASTGKAIAALILGIVTLFIAYNINDAASNGLNQSTEEINNNSKTNTVSTSSSNTAGENSKAEKKYKLGETWTVDGQWKLTIDSVTTTSDRNQFSDKNPAQVIIITYTYENIGYEDDYMDGLYISLDSVIDEKGAIAETYPGQITTYAQEIPIGAKCIGAQECFGLNNNSNTITLNFSKYDSNNKKQKATFELEVQQ